MRTSVLDLMLDPLHTGCMCSSSVDRMSCYNSLAIGDIKESSLAIQYGSHFLNVWYDQKDSADL